LSIRQAAVKGPGPIENIRALAHPIADILGFIMRQRELLLRYHDKYGDLDPDDVPFGDGTMSVVQENPKKRIEEVDGHQK
jgi:hypothetical protein